MATVVPSSCADKSSDIPQLSPPLLHALAVAAKKPAASCRPDLAPGRYDIDAAVSIHGVLTVGQDTVTASSVTPQPELLLAHILSKLNTATRAKLLCDLPVEFAANDNEMPVTEESLVEAVQYMLAKLRRTVSRPRRGAVSGNFDIQVVPALAMSKLAIAG